MKAIVTMDYLPNTGGVAVYWSNLYNNLPKTDYLLITPGKFSEGAEMRFDFFYKFIWPKWLKLLFNLARVIKQRDIDLIIAGQILPIGTVCMFLKKFKLLRKFHISCHGMDLGILKGRKKLLAKYILQQSDKILVNSEVTKKLVLDFGQNENKIYLVRPCPDKIPDSNLDIKHQLGISTDNIIISTGRLVARKGFDKVITSLLLVWKQIPDLVYIILGEGEYRSELLRIIEKHIPVDKQNNIKLVGYVSNKDKAGYMKSAKIFVLPTRNIQGDQEGFGIVNIEAGVFGLPVIAGKISGATGSVIPDRTGLLVDPENENEIAEKIIYLLKNPGELRRLGDGNRLFANSFNWKDEAKIFIRHTSL